MPPNMNDLFGPLVWTSHLDDPHAMCQDVAAANDEHLLPVFKKWMSWDATGIPGIWYAVYKYTPRPGVPPEGLSCDQLFKVYLGFV